MKMKELYSPRRRVPAWTAHFRSQHPLPWPSPSPSTSSPACVPPAPLHCLPIHLFLLPYRPPSAACPSRSWISSSAARPLHRWSRWSSSTWTHLVSPTVSCYGLSPIGGQGASIRLGRLWQGGAGVGGGHGEGGEKWEGEGGASVWESVLCRIISEIWEEKNWTHS